MLTHLQVKGLVTLNEADLDFGPGLTAVTGETGAGKTVLLTSLGLIKGDRAQSALVDPQAQQVEVDATFVIPAELQSQLDQAGYTVDAGEAIFSRTVLATGSSKANISGRPVAAKTLALNTQDLVTIHGQAGQWQLKSQEHQRDILDGYGGAQHEKVVADYGKQWQITRKLEERFAETKRGWDQRQGEKLLLEQVLAQAEEMDIRADEDERIARTIDRLTNVEQLREYAEQALELLADTAQQVGSATDTLRKAAMDDEALTELAQRASSVEAETTEMVTDLRDYLDGLFADPQELANQHSRRAALTELMRGRASSSEEFVDWLVHAEQRLHELESGSLDPCQVEQELKEAQTILLEKQENLTASRQAIAETLGKKVTGELQELGLKGGALHVDVRPAAPTSHGADMVEMLLQSHPKAPAAPLAQGASGGELSRVMLALEVVLADGAHSRTFVFDEIDAGIGGTTAAVVASRLALLAQTHQVIVVTHLAQVAAVANTNFVVEKQDGKAAIRVVEGEEKTSELVRMLGGETKDGAARRLALQLQNRADMTQSAL